MLKQRTLKESFSLRGKGLHTGLDLTVTFNPAPENHGYKIQRIDLEGQPIIDAVADHVIETTHAEIGCKILQTWDFPAELSSIPKDHLKFDRQVKSVDYTDLVLVANLQSYAGTNHPLAKIDLKKVSAFSASADFGSNCGRLDTSNRTASGTMPVNRCRCNCVKSFARRKIASAGMMPARSPRRCQYVRPSS